MPLLLLYLHVDAIQEKLLVIVSLCIGVVSISVPVYYRLAITGADSDE